MSSTPTVYVPTAHSDAPPSTSTGTTTTATGGVYVPSQHVPTKKKKKDTASKKKTKSRKDGSDGLDPISTPPSTSNKNGKTKYQISLFAQNLVTATCFGASVPSCMAVVEITGGPLGAQVIGETEIIPRASNPDWVAIFSIETNAAIHTPLKVTVYHCPKNKKSHKLELGTADFELTSVFTAAGKSSAAVLAAGKRQAKHGAAPPTLTVHVEEARLGHDDGIVTMQLRGLDMKNVEPGPFGLGRSDPFFQISKKNADYSIAQVHWNVVYRSEVIDDNLNPYWRPFSLDMETLCYGQLDYPLLVSVWDHNANGIHTMIGQFETTLPQLQQSIAVKGNADREKAIPLSQEAKFKTYGLICVLQCSIDGASGSHQV